MDAVNHGTPADRLHADWTYIRESQAATDQVMRWSHRWLGLAGCESPDDVLAACYFVDGMSDAALSALLRIVNGRYEGGELAARLMLRSLLPPAMRENLPCQPHGFSDPGEAVAALIVGLVEAIATYPLDRRTNVKGQLLERAGTVYRREVRAYGRATHRLHAFGQQPAATRDGLSGGPAALGGQAGPVDEERTDPLLDAAETLTAAVRRDLDVRMAPRLSIAL
jgi:hypothetical protein